MRMPSRLIIKTACSRFACPSARNRGLNRSGSASAPTAARDQAMKIVSDVGRAMHTVGKGGEDNEWFFCMDRQPGRCSFLYVWQQAVRRRPTHTRVKLPTKI